MAFKPQLFDPQFKALTTDDVLDALPAEPVSHVTRLVSGSELHIPIDNNSDDTESIIEFFLNKEWHEIPPHIQQASLDFIQSKNGGFKQLDGIALVEV